MSTDCADGRGLKKIKDKKSPRITRIYTNEKKKEGLSTDYTDWHELEKKGGARPLGRRGWLLTARGKVGSQRGN